MGGVVEEIKDIGSDIWDATYGTVEDVVHDELWGSITGEKQWEETREQQERQMREVMDFAREITEEMKARLPVAESRLLSQYLLAKDQLARSMGRVLGQMKQTQAQHARLLSRVGNMGYLSSGALENVYRASAEEIAKTGLGIFSQYGSTLAQLEADLGGKLAALPVEYLRGAGSMLGIAPQYMQATAAMLAARPPSLFDRMIQVGTLALLGLAVL